LFEIVLFRPAVVGPQDVNFGIFPQALDCIAIFSVKVAEVFLRELTGGPSLVRIDRHVDGFIMFLQFLLLLIPISGLCVFGHVVGVALEVVVE
jgi:hypothetical protein